LRSQILHGFLVIVGLSCVDYHDVEVFVARQAIFDQNRRVHGYELLFRTTADCNEFDAAAGTQATAEVISNCLFAVGLDNLRGGKTAFVNFDRRMLLQEWYKTLPPKSTVIELLETITPDAEVLAACRSLSKQGYRIALDDFVFHAGYERLLDVVNLVKIEVASIPRTEQEEMIRVYHARKLKVVAEKVETYEQFEWARKAGYDLFQGYFFARPALMRGQQILATKVNYLRLLREVQRPELDFNRLGALISEDVAFSYKLIRYASSALFSRRGRIQSIRQALVTLGEDNIRRWASLVTLLKVAEDKPGELVACSLVRAKFCELMGQLVQAGLQEPAFLMGLFSMLDALLDRPLGEALAEVRLAPRITEALLGIASEGDPLTTLYKLARRYEAADWEEVDRLVEELKTPANLALQAYGDAVQWANETLLVNIV
jgi:c-di-GMP-related signal transduction protein